MAVARNTGGPSVYKYAHKLYEPRAQLSAIHRDDLLGRMFGPEPARIVLVQGPAGHGKTTLLQQAMAECRARDMSARWFTADEADNDLRRLAMHLQTLLVSLEESPPGAAGGVRPAGLIEERGSRADGLIARLQKFPKPVALFFDDFHALANRSVLAFFRDFLDRLPAHVRVFIGSRSVPEVGLARLVVNHQALLLRAEELRFSPMEVRRFFATAQDLAIRDEELDAIYRKTEGWPAALQLFRLSLASPSVRRSLADLGAHRPRELAEYLADNVLALQAEEVQSFLLHTAPLRRLSGPLCDAVLGRQHSQAVLLGLERAGLFVRSLDAAHRWFGYHALFASLLEDQLREEAPDKLRETHLRAATWFSKHGMLEDALHHAVACADHALSADLLDQWSSRLVALGHLVTVETWYEALPLDEIAKRPELVVKVAWALCFLRRHQKIKPVAAMLRKLRGTIGRETHPDIVASMLALLDDDIPACHDIVRTIEIRGHSPEGFSAFEYGAAANLRAFLELASGDIERAREDLILARVYGDRAEAGFSLGYSISMMSMVLMAQGQLPQALEHLREGLALPWMRLDDSVSSAVISACHVHALYEAGDLDAAEAHFERSHEAIAQFALLDYVCVAFIAMSRIHEVRGRPALAVELLDELDGIGHARLWPRLVHRVGWERVRRLLLRGELDRAQAAASRIAAVETPAPAGWIMYCEDTSDDLIGQARLDLYRGRIHEALEALDAELRVAQRSGRVHRQIKLGVLKALCEKAGGRETVARESFSKVLDLARPGGFQRCILEEGPGVIVLLRQARGEAGRDAETIDRQAFVARLLDACGEGGSAEPAPGSLPYEALTEREKKILVLLANGVSNEEIASRMFVSRNTIKFHLKNIYSKLAVNSRLQAINAARAMGLIR